MIILAANEREQILYRILIEHTHRIKLAGLVAEMFMCVGPLGIAFAKINVQTEISAQQIVIVCRIVQPAIDAFRLGTLLRRCHFETNRIEFPTVWIFNFAKNLVQQLIITEAQQPHTIRHHAHPCVIGRVIAVGEQIAPGFFPSVNGNKHRIAVRGGNGTMRFCIARTPN